MAHDQALKISFASQKHRLLQQLMSRLETNAVTTSKPLITFLYCMLCKTCLSNLLLVCFVPLVLLNTKCHSLEERLKASFFSFYHVSV